VAQNIYDDPGFFAGYSTLPRSIDGLDGAPEWPTLRDMLPPIAGRSLLDLGCGFGWFSRWAASMGAASVLGIDLSERMLARAVAETTDPRVAYERQDLDDVRLPVERFDVAYSSLALHYLTRLDALIARVHRSLVPGGVFVVSVEHPIFTAPSQPRFVDGDDGQVHWPLNRYLDEGSRTTDWLSPGVIKQHRTIATYFRLLHDAGFTVDSIVEWGPSADQIETVPRWAPEIERPPFLFFAATRSSAGPSKPGRLVS
jgi:SAM-dependent methyltransferase